MAESARKTRRQVFKEDTRRIILDAAYGLFVEKGYGPCTMRMLAGRAGVGLGTIFKHFPDKPSILVAAFQEDLGRVTAEAMATLPGTGFKAQLLHLAGKLYAFYARDVELGRILVREALFLTGPHGEQLDQQLDFFIRAVAGLLEAASDRGESVGVHAPEQGALAFASFYLAVLIQGLKAPAFDLAAQLGLLALLLDNHFPGLPPEKSQS